MKQYLLTIAVTQLAVAPINNETVQIIVNAAVTLVTVWISKKYELKINKKKNNDKQL